MFQLGVPGVFQSDSHVTMMVYRIDLRVWIGADYRRRS